MAAITTTWNAGTTGDWFSAANWTPAVVPTVGYSVQIGSGTAIVSTGSPAVQGLSILLGGLATGEPVILEADNATFEGQSTPTLEFMTIQVAGGHPFLSPLHALFLVKGSTSYDGQILVGAMGGGLTILSETDGTTAGNFTFDNADGRAAIVVEQQSVLTFAGQTITNGGLIEVLGGLEIESGVTFTGHGIVALEDGGNITISGNVGADQRFDFADETGLLTLRHLEGFHGSLGFTELGGARIDLAGLHVQSVAVDAALHVLDLYAAPGQQGAKLGSIAIASIDPETLGTLPFDLASGDFALGSDGDGGTLVTYAPQNGIDLQQSLPTAIVASAGTMVTFASILQNAFGTANPGFTSITLLPTKPFQNTATDLGYWETSNITPQWFLNGAQVTTATQITAAQIGQVMLRVGNQIIDPAQFVATVTSATSGPQSERITYNAWSVDPRIVGSVTQAGFTGPPTPDAIVASATAFDQVFGHVLNTNLCNWIADNVAAGAGASMPLPNAYLDPTLNVEGGFWRIFYTGTGQPTPVSDWGTLVRPGDVVRMGWFHPESGAESGHTTTVLAGVGANGDITVYDNIDDVVVNGTKQEYIGIHGNADYWKGTDPADITIYRLDSNQQYLILGTPLGEIIAGSVFDDLIRPGGGSDIIIGGPGDDEIQDTTANLNGVTVTDLATGDRLDFTDLDPTSATLSFASGVLSIGDGTHSASLTLPGSTKQVFVVTPDGHGGSFVDRLDKVTLTGSYPSGYVAAPTVGGLTIASGAVVGGTGVSLTSEHASLVANLGTVHADSLSTGISMRGGGRLVNGSASNATASISGRTGVSVKGFGVVTNYGVIASTAGGTALSLGSAESRLIEYASGQLDGSVNGGGGTLELARSSVAGTLSGLGGQISGFGGIEVDARAVWTLAGGATLKSGTLLTNNGKLALTGNIRNSGAIDNAAGATLDLQGDYGIGKVGHLVNAGTLLKSAGTGVSLVQAGGNLDSSGKIVVQTGTLQLAGSLIHVTGPISGAGTIAFGPGISSLSENASVRTAGLSVAGTNAMLVVAESLSYDGTFSAGAGTILRTSAASASTGVSGIVRLKGTASFDRSTVGGFGQLRTQGQTTVHGVTLGDYATWNNTGTLVETASLVFSGINSSLLNSSTGVLTLQGKTDIVSAGHANVFRNEGQVIKAGGSTSTISSALVNNGLVEVADGNLVLTGPVSGNGTLQIDAGRTLRIDGAVGDRQTVAFSAGRDRLVLSDAVAFAGRLSGFGAGDKLDLTNVAFSSATVGFVENNKGTAGTLTIGDATHHADILLLGQYAASGFRLSADGQGGTFVSYVPPPEAGVHLATP
jgi:hypothetical protein